MKKLIRSRMGQGTTEYILILAIAVTIGAVIFWPKIKPILEGKVGTLGTQIQDAGK